VNDLKDRGQLIAREASEMKKEPVITILAKTGMYSILGITTAPVFDDSGELRAATTIAKLDPRENSPVYKPFDTANEATLHYQQAIDTSLERGWLVVYQGTPLRG
jgi:hypothetical protein